MNSWQIGDVKVTSIVEIEAPVPGEAVIPSAAPSAVQQHGWLVPHFATEDGLLHLRIQLLVIESQGRRIAVDTCLGNDKPRTNEFFSHLQTPFLQSLEAAGFARESFDAVVCTHLHVDHVGWNTMLVDGEWVPTFPNARYLIGRVESEHWDAYGLHEDGDLYGDSVRPVIEAGLVDHSDVAAARATRCELLARYADTDVLVIGTHFAGPGGGRIVADGDAWRFVV